MTNYAGAKIAYNYYNYGSICEWSSGVTLVPHDDDERLENGEYKFVGFYFEVYLDNPKTYYCSSVALTLEEAEKNAFDKYQSYLNCSGHEYERRNYKNGVGFCKHCNLFKSKAFLPLTLCVVCQNPTQFCRDKNENYYCEMHESSNNDEHYLSRKKARENMRNRKIDTEKFKKTLEIVVNSIAKEKNI
ncbi:hypothetical protein [Fluviispira vulneris]|uniref:hypothetical protein n=1 Tax=Fluviispira vulneris TaxID=2763012 RepID=UPI0016477FCB|nr:hypothetical protein [Fluviispira vulneris]